MKYKILCIQLSLIVLAATSFSFTKFRQESEWTSQKSGVFTRLSSVFFIDKNKGWAVGASGTILTTVDGGEKWTKSKLPDDQQKVNIRDLWIHDDIGASSILGEYVTLGAKGFSNQSDKTLILNRECVDDSWKKGDIEPVSAKTLLISFYFANAKTGWACGERGTIIKTIDGGSKWKSIDTITEKLLYAVTSFKNNIWVAGSAGTIIKSEDEGNSWKNLHSGINDVLRAIHFTSESQGWAVGANGAVIKTSDGGKTWTKLPPPTSETLLTCWFFNNNEGWVAGFNGTLMKTSDGGQTWDDLTVNSHADLTRLFFLNQNIGWLVGANGVIYKYEK